MNLEFVAPNYRPISSLGAQSTMLQRNNAALSNSLVSGMVGGTGVGLAQRFN